MDDTGNGKKRLVDFTLIRSIWTEIVKMRMEERGLRVCCRREMSLDESMPSWPSPNVLNKISFKPYANPNPKTPFQACALHSVLYLVSQNTTRLLKSNPRSRWPKNASLCLDV
jgi:hypothetical protein